jgi:hypothetical protein
MDPIGSYLALARSATVAEFVSRCDTAFLVKRPRARLLQLPEPSTITFETRLTTIDVDPFADEWQVAPIKKRDGNPFPDRISIGRAPNCDIVIRLPSISKVHAHIVIADGLYSLVDNGAANSTFINRIKLANKVAVSVRFGDKIALGPVEFEFVDAKSLHHILRTEVTATK